MIFVLRIISEDEYPTGLADALPAIWQVVPARLSVADRAAASHYANTQRIVQKSKEAGFASLF